MARESIAVSPNVGNYSPNDVALIHGTLGSYHFVKALYTFS